MSESSGGDATSPGIDRRFLTAWFLERVPDVAPPLRFVRVAGGRSNLTHLVEDFHGRRWAHRRPPLHSRLASAHDMGREYRILSALGRTDIPVPSTVGIGEDPSGAEFYVTEFVEGLVLRGVDDARPLSVAQRRSAGLELVDVLADIHAVDPDGIGLGDLGRREAYIARQLKRWHGQWEAQRTQDLPGISAIHEALSERIPPQGPPGIVHGDYRFDNTVLSPDGHLVAVLDWELCTLGDPLADLGLLMVFWEGPGAVRADDEVPISALEGFPSRDVLLARYVERSGRDASRLAFYRAFGYWKLAIVLEGVYARHIAGAYGELDTLVRQYPTRVRLLATAAAGALDEDS